MDSYISYLPILLMIGRYFLCLWVIGLYLVNLYDETLHERINPRSVAKSITQ